jgi:DNA-binding transcriptional MerR regulator
MLKLTVDTLDGIDDAIKSLYAERDGKFTLQVDGIEDTAGLKTALQKERKTAGELEKQTKAWKNLGKTPEEIAELLEAQEARAQTDAERKGEWDKLRAQMNEKHAKELSTKEETINQMRRRLESELVDAKAVSAIAAAKGVPDLLLPIVQRQVKVDENFNVVVVDAKGDPRVNVKGEPLNITDLIAEMRASEIYGRAFEGSGQSGSGTRPSNGTGGTGGRITKADLKERASRASFVEQHGHEAYFALPDK